jgi:hypothetical protein
VRSGKREAREIDEIRIERLAAARTQYVAGELRASRPREQLGYVGDVRDPRCKRKIAATDLAKALAVEPLARSV